LHESWLDDSELDESWLDDAIRRLVLRDGAGQRSVRGLCGRRYPKARRNPDPEYPEIARRMNISGTVKVELVIAADGTIKSAKVLGGHPLLADSVQKALRKWKYAPGASETTMQLDFKF